VESAREAHADFVTKFLQGKRFAETATRHGLRAQKSVRGGKLPGFRGEFAPDFAAFQFDYRNQTARSAQTDPLLFHVERSLIPAWAPALAKPCLDSRTFHVERRVRLRAYPSNLPQGRRIQASSRQSKGYNEADEGTSSSNPALSRIALCYPPPRPSRRFCNRRLIRPARLRIDLREPIHIPSPFQGKPTTSSIRPHYSGLAFRYSNLSGIHRPRLRRPVV